MKSSFLPAYWACMGNVINLSDYPDEKSFRNFLPDNLSLPPGWGKVRMRVTQGECFCPLTLPSPSVGRGEKGTLGGERGKLRASSMPTRGRWKARKPFRSMLTLNLMPLACMGVDRETR